MDVMIKSDEEAAKELSKYTTTMWNIWIKSTLNEKQEINSHTHLTKLWDKNRRSENKNWRK